jgi:hypothetical protein
MTSATANAIFLSSTQAAETYLTVNPSSISVEGTASAASLVTIQAPAGYGYVTEQVWASTGISDQLDLGQYLDAGGLEWGFNQVVAGVNHTPLAFVGGNATMGYPLGEGGTANLAVNGSVGINTLNPSAPLEVDQFIAGYTNVPQQVWGTADNSGSLVLSQYLDANGLQWRFTQTNVVLGVPATFSPLTFNQGNVGIGTTGPQAMLDVNGNAYVRGNLIVPGTLVNGTVVTSGSSRLLIPQQGDLSMGGFTAGPTPQ